MKKNILYLLEMGMYDNNISTDIKNHLVRVVENVDIIYKGEKYNMFFEFTQGTHSRYTATGKRTVFLKDGLFVDTQFEKFEGTRKNGTPYYSSWSKLDLEKEIIEEHHEYTKKDVLDVVNRYKVGEKYTDVCLIKTTATEIIRNIGSWREKDILGENKDFQTEGASYFTKGDTWTDEHKIVVCNKEEWKPTKNGKKLVVVDSCKVDIVTGKITG